MKKRLPSVRALLTGSTRRRVSAMDNRLAQWGLTTQFDAFLFAPLCEDRNGLQLSMLSVLARINRDPWKEAARLAAMPRANAETSLVSSLRLAAVSGWDPAQASNISSRLVALLPRAEVAAPVIPGAQGPHAQRVAYLLMWLGLVMTMALLAPNYRAVTKDETIATSTSVAPIPATNSETQGTDLGGQQ
jgi:hypothetical protein